MQKLQNATLQCSLAEEWCYTYSMDTNIIIYSADWCAYCHAAKEYLDKLGVKYTEKNVEEDPSNAQESVNKSQQMGIPVLDIKGTIIVGFDRPKIDEALKANKLV